MRGRAAVGCAAAAVVLSGCAAGIQDLPVGRSLPGENYTVTLELAGADGLLVGADVRSGQRVIGRVAGLSTRESGAAAQLSLSRSAPVPRDVSAAVELPSALGSPFVRLRVPQDPSPALLADGDVIAESRTEVGPQLESALATLGTVLSGSGVDQLATVVDELNTAFADRPQQVGVLLDAASALTGTATDRLADLDASIGLAADVSRRWAERQEALDGFLAVVPAATTVLAGQRDRLAALAASSARLAEHADAVLAAGDLDALVGDGATVVASLRSFNDRIGETLTAMNTFTANFGRAVKGDYLVFDGTLDVPAGLETLMTGGIPLDGAGGDR
ncbi:MCE family protein [Prescottella subtropica]|uniref:MCE family protein n=1 Tax=Prescottella subtropica TaxID=2545757 RepID=UPI0010FA3527|nr:MCE family protein [Prescottella subtropica]